MRKIFTSIFVLLGISLLFISCDLLADILSPIDKIYLYTLDDYGNETTTLSIYEEGYQDLSYEITYYSEYTTSCDVEVYSSDESVATVDWDSGTVKSEGCIRVYGKGEGTCTITMKSTKYSNEYASVEVNVKAKPLKFKTHNLRLDKGNPEKKSATLEYINTTGSRVYLYIGSSYSNTSYYADITEKGTNSYLIEAKRAGSFSITIKTSDAKWSDICTVTIDDSSNVSVTITNGYNIPVDLYPGQDPEYKHEFQLEASVFVGTSGISNDIFWYSENPSIVSVNAETGLIKALSEGTTKVYACLSYNKSICDYVEVKVKAVPIPANPFFWGKWVRMDTGTTYTVEETYLLLNNIKYGIISSDKVQLTVETLGKFTKDSENIIKWHDDSYDVDVPFYRQGGKDLKYKVRVVGFEDEISENGNANIFVSRAAGESTGKKNLKVKGQSERYSTYTTDEVLTDDNGFVDLTAPVQGDTQTLTITDDDGEITVVSGLKIENDGVFMGTIPLVKKNEYSLKITGSVPDSAKTNGYLYAKNNTNRKYPLALTISNISEIKSEPATAVISCSDTNVFLKILSTNISNYINDEGNIAVNIPTMKPGATLPIQFEVAYESLSYAYKDVELDVRVINEYKNRTWVDYVPLRFFAGDMPISILAKPTIIRDDFTPALNGFVIYPDGNSKFFTVSENKSTTLYVPVFGMGHKYEMVFSGATVTNQISDSTEMLYTVNLDSTTPSPIVDSAFSAANKFGEDYKGVNNNSEATAFDINEYFAEQGLSDKKDFQAYLKENDIDFYLFETHSNSTTVHN